jgi:hypothetical protein
MQAKDQVTAKNDSLERRTSANLQFQRGGLAFPASEQLVHPDAFASLINNLLFLLAV